MTLGPQKKVLVIVPSAIIARGLESLLSDFSDFTVDTVLTELPRGGESRLRNLAADVILLDPFILDQNDRNHARALFSPYSDAPLVAVQTAPIGAQLSRQFDGVISLTDEPALILRTLRGVAGTHREAPQASGTELSAREKEILVCVAKGMLNKEIADCCNLSIHTVITHRKNITRKTGIKTVAGLTVYALLNNLIDTDTLE